ncbi:MAG: hypothetical protein EOP82_01120 [Variovorax sp.]|nr:MAG: hypothetical protein EOP82_01120 [Variovorax sp.]
MNPLAVDRAGEQIDSWSRWCVGSCAESRKSATAKAARSTEAAQRFRDPLRASCAASSCTHRGCAILTGHRDVVGRPSNLEKQSMSNTLVTIADGLTRLAADRQRPYVTIADVLAALGEGSTWMLTLLFALPNAVPMLPGTSTVLGMPLLFLTIQLASGRRPWCLVGLPDDRCGGPSCK